MDLCGYETARNCFEVHWPSWLQLMHYRRQPPTSSRSLFNPIYRLDLHDASLIHCYACLASNRASHRYLRIKTQWRRHVANANDFPTTYVYYRKISTLYSRIPRATNYTLFGSDYVTPSAAQQVRSNFSYADARGSSIPNLYLENTYTIIILLLITRATC